MISKNVSIVIPTRNEEKFIGSTIDSILSQCYNGKIEIIISDGRSTDDTRNIVIEYQRKYPEIVKLVDNPGINSSSGRQIGIEHAGGEYILLFLCHSIMPRNYVSTLVHILEENPDFDCVGTDYEGIGVEDNIFRKAVDHVTSSILGGAGIMSNRSIGTGIDKESISTAFCLYRKSALENIEFDSRFVFGQDFEFNYRLFKSGKRMLFTSRIKAFKYDKWSNSPKKFFWSFFWAGYARMQITKKHPSSLRMIHLIPSIFVLSLLVFPIIIFLPDAFTFAYVTYLIAYSIIVLFFSILGSSSNKKSIYCLAICPFFYFLLHFSYGLGYIIGIFSSDLWGRGHETGIIIK